MRAGMLLFSFLCIALGIYPAPLYALLPYAVGYVPYTGSHVVEQLQLLLLHKAVGANDVRAGQQAAKELPVHIPKDNFETKRAKYRPVC